MSHFSTLDPPAMISYFTPSRAPITTNVSSGLSLGEERIRSAFEGAKRELGRYEQYPASWDGYRAEPFERDVLDGAWGILSYSQAVFLNAGVIPKLVTTGPASDGSIDVEFQVADKRVLMTLYPREKELRLSSFDAREAHDYVAPLGTQTLAEWLSWLHHSDTVPKAMGQNRIHP